MIDDFIKLKNIFNIIKKAGWVKSMRTGTTGIGYTFETLIGKVEEQFPIPDFGCIEIKTKNKNSVESITLFNASPDGDYLYPIKYLYANYGFNNKTNPVYKVFYASVSSKERFAGKQYRFRLNIDRNNELIRLVAIDKAGNFEDTHVSWTFNLLREKLNCKIKYLALVKANTRFINNSFYYNYDEINFYVLKGFDEFIKLLEDGAIKIIFKIGAVKSGVNQGKMDNHGTGFNIDENDLEKLYFRL